MVTSTSHHPVTSSTVTTPARTVAAMTDTPQPAPSQAALETLAAALDPRDFATTLTTGDGRPPRLTVTSRHAQFGDDIYADSSSYWWSWAERIATVDDPMAAARAVATVLRTASEPS
jgi:hypothetical protein